MSNVQWCSRRLLASLFLVAFIYMPGTNDAKTYATSEKVPGAVTDVINSVLKDVNVDDSVLGKDGAARSSAPSSKEDGAGTYKGGCKNSIGDPCGTTYSRGPGGGLS
jgi:hypothetical protein